MSRQLEVLRATVLHQVAGGAPADDVLRSICTALQEHLAGTVVGVTMLDRTSKVFEQAIFPSLSDEYADALKGIKVMDRPGSCALAVFKGRTVICRDVTGDSRFSVEWKSLGLKHGLRALVSVPAVDPKGLTLGTLVIAHEPGAPLTRGARRIASEIAELCGLVLQYRRNQMRNELLLGEMGHRMRNLFSTVGAVVYATLRHHSDPEEFREIFDGRLKALAKAHSLAVNAGETELRQLIQDTLAPYSFNHEIDIKGSRFMLTQEAGIALSLATHELATNAAKYGSLSTDGGSVQVQWGIDESASEPRFELSWSERGGPPVKPPTRQGFGQKTLKRGVQSAFDGAVDLEYDPTGLRCRIVAPMSPRLGSSLNKAAKTNEPH